MTLKQKKDSWLGMYIGGPADMGGLGCTWYKRLDNTIGDCPSAICTRPYNCEIVLTTYIGMKGQLDCNTHGEVILAEPITGNLTPNQTAALEQC